MKLARNTSLIAVGLLALGVLGVAGIAQATSHGKTIHSCVAKSNGALRVVKRVGACSHRERALAFNERGARGPRGARGRAGKSAPTVAFQMYANVDAEGELGSNVGAVSASRVATGTYLVVFSRPIAKCAAVAQSGAAGGTDPVFVVPSAVRFDPSNADAWDVEFEDSSTRTDESTPFMLTITCGA
jgi:hypothetical protein